MKKPNKTKTNQHIATDQLAAWTDIDHLEQSAKVAIPSKRGVEEAKEWVEDTEK